MALAICIDSVEVSGNGIRIGFNLTPSGTYTTAVGGDILDFTTAVQGIRFQGVAAIIPSSCPPLELNVWSQGGLLGYPFYPVRGTTQANCRLIIGSIATLGTELGTGAYPAAVIAGAVRGSAVFNKGI